MKKKNLTTKLTLNKQTVSSLTVDEKAGIIGGVSETGCPECPTDVSVFSCAVCNSIVDCTQQLCTIAGC